MRRGSRWWGTAPVVVGATGLLLIVFGAKGLPDSEEINTPARQKAQMVEKALNDVQSDKDLTPLERRRVIASVLAQAQEQLQEEGKSLDLRSVAPQGMGDMDSSVNWVARVRDALIDARSDGRDPKDVLAGRIAFYAGLILVFAAGVLLYRRTPESVHM